MFGHRGLGRRGLSLIVAAAATALTTAACGAGGGEGGEAGGPVTLNLTWWGDDDRAARYREAIALFEQQHDDIKVNANFSDWDAYWTARSTEAAGRSLPDVMQFDLSYLREYSQNGHLLNLAPYVGEQIDVSGFDETLIESGKIDDEQIGIPVSTNTLALFVNSQLVEAAGVEMLEEDYTWEEYNDWVREISESGATNQEGRQIYGGGDYTGTMWFFMQWLLQRGVEPFAEDGSFNFTEDDVRQYLNLTADLRDDDLVFPADRAVQVQPLDGFHVNEQASSFTWDNFLATYAEETGGANIEMLPVPTGPNGEKAMFWKPSMLYSAGANTEHPEEAAELINFLLTEPEVGRIFGTSQGVRADEEQRDAVQPEEGSVDAQVTEFEQRVTDDVTAEVPVPIQGFGSIEATWLRLSQDLLYGRISVDEFVEQWFAEAEMATQ